MSKSHGGPKAGTPLGDRKKSLKAQKAGTLIRKSQAPSSRKCGSQKPCNLIKTYISHNGQTSTKCLQQISSQNYAAKRHKFQKIRSKKHEISSANLLRKVCCKNHTISQGDLRKKKVRSN